MVEFDVDAIAEKHRQEKCVEELEATCRGVSVAQMHEDERLNDLHKRGMLRIAPYQIALSRWRVFKWWMSPDSRLSDGLHEMYTENEGIGECKNCGVKYPCEAIGTVEDCSGILVRCKRCGCIRDMTCMIHTCD